jgi:hypothetical protein
MIRCDPAEHESIQHQRDLLGFYIVVMLTGSLRLKDSSYPDSCGCRRRHQRMVDAADSYAFVFAAK